MYKPPYTNYAEKKAYLASIMLRKVEPSPPLPGTPEAKALDGAAKKAEAEYLNWAENIGRPGYTKEDIKKAEELKLLKKSKVKS